MHIAESCNRLFAVTLSIVLTWFLLRWHHDIKVGIDVHTRSDFTEFTKAVTIAYIICIISVDGNWGNWGAWGSLGACSMSCCGGTQSQSRTRMCDNPPASGSGATCPGSDTDSQSLACNEFTCPCMYMYIYHHTTL